jgi:Carboxypeptidase regulatory-like domain
MNRHQNQKLKRLLSVNNYFADNSAITATLLKATVWQPQLDTIANDIIKHSAVQSTPFKGSTQAKNALKQQITEASFFIATCAKAYSRSVNDTPLYAQVDYTQSKIKSLNDTTLLNTANIIYTAANANITAISGVTTLTPAHLVTLKTLIADFTKYIPQSKSVRDAIKIHTQAIAVLIEDSNKLLNEIADYVELTQFTEPVFYQGFLNANKIGNAITRNRALQINVIDKNTQTPILKADITITDATGKIIATKKTTNKGNAYLQDLKEQDYTINIVQVGYATHTTNISITDGTTLILPIALETNI